jgi:DnaJ-class molecular chaperone
MLGGDKMDNESPIRGRWCDRCKGTGTLPTANYSVVRCPDCNFVGFVGVTSEQVRQAELEATSAR